MKYLALTFTGSDGTTQDFNNIPNIPTGGTDTLRLIFSNVIEIAFAIAAILALLYLIKAGFDWTTSGGDKQKVEKARNGITYSIVGLIIIFFAYFIVNVIEYFFKGA